MGYDDRKTTSIVRLNAKLSSVNLEHLEDAGVDIDEGIFIKEDTNGKAAIAVGTDHAVFMNFLGTSHGSVRDETKDTFDETAPVITQSSGGLSGITGNATPLGLHKSRWDGTPAHGQLVTVGAGGKPLGVAVGGIGAAVPYFGVIHRVRGEFIWFLFNSIARVTGV